MVTMPTAYQSQGADFAIESHNSLTPTRYVAVVDGEVTQTYNLQPNDEIREREGGFVVVDGEVLGGVDAFDYEGCICQFHTGGASSFTVRKNGVETAPADVADCSPCTVAGNPTVAVAAGLLGLVGGVAYERYREE